MNMKIHLSKIVALLGIAILTSTCSQSNTDQLIVYSGRSQALVDQLVTDFKEETGIDVEVRYGNDAELLAVLNEEGDQSPADLYWANTTGALATASKQGLLETLPDSLLNKPDSFTSTSGKWIPITVRYRVLAYNPQTVDSTELPSSVMDINAFKKFEGRIGWTPTYSSFYDFLTTMRLTKGDEVARAWLNNMSELDPKSYSSNTPMVQAILGGEIDVALTNHYYVIQTKYGGKEGYFEDHEHYGEDEPNPDANIETYHFENGDIGNLALVTGATQLKTADDPELVAEFLSFLLSKQAQEYAAQSVNEYPVIEEVALPEYMLESKKALKLSPDYDYEQLQQLEGTLNLLREVGII
ncbi:iron ABC transporter substrate-binding protein [Fodinibius salsisoli]|uniref:Iron ABC transporter substrate-binding protein n=1 Tax=Fodinibius salsisoli TaxID=2820877 RepID=A0ABT3PM94_9BACT|nr:iron ABC transporter substrate-binding protein [Fodinibius salsisoli]MCW9707076.1 iron ABC transporter substrate-binding protein [Fodinibius salsisoli]